MVYHLMIFLKLINIMKTVLIRVYCGMTIENRDTLHPLNEVKAAQRTILRKKSTDCYSNSPDFVSTMKYFGEKEGVQVEFFLDGISLGNNIEPIFEDFNRALDYMDKICAID